MTEGKLENKVQKGEQKSPRDKYFNYLAIAPPHLLKISINIHFYILYLCTKLKSDNIGTLLSLLSKYKNSPINRITLFKWIEMQDKIKTFRVWTLFWSKGDAHQWNLAQLPLGKGGFILSFQKKKLRGGKRSDWKITSEPRGLYNTRLYFLICSYAFSFHLPKGNQNTSLCQKMMRENFQNKGIKISEIWLGFVPF